MTIQDLISNIDDVNEATVIYARKIDGKFTAYSEVILLELPEEDGDLLIKDITARYCPPEFDYFLEGFLVREMVQDIREIPEYKTLEQQVNRVIYYAEFDA